MATIKPTVLDVSFRKNGGCQQVIWTPVTSSDTCAAVSLPEYSDRSIQVEGTFGSASVALKGSNDGTNFEALRDPGGTTIAISAAGLKAVLENTVLSQPVATNGDGTQSLTIAMLFHFPQPLRV